MTSTSTIRTRLEYNCQQLHALEKYFEAIQISAMPPLLQDDPLYTMAQLNELSSSTLLLGQQCMRAGSEDRALFFPALKEQMGRACRSLTTLCLSLEAGPESIWGVDSWHDPRDFASRSEGEGGDVVRSGLYQLFGRFDELVNRVLSIQQGMQNLVYQTSAVEGEGAIQVVREALQRLWHTFASLSVNLNTELARVLLEDLEHLAQELTCERENAPGA